jgi:predicted XRE-type DNA-binding protein
LNKITAAIIAAIHEQEISQYQLAKLSGINQAQISRLLAGGDIRCDTADKLMSVLGLFVRGGLAYKRM